MLSRLLLDVSKDRLYADHSHSLRRRSAQTTVAVALRTLVQSFAPALVHTAEDIFQHTPNPVIFGLDPDGSTGSKEAPRPPSVFATPWFDAEESLARWHNPEVERDWALLLEVMHGVHAVLEQARVAGTVRHSLDATVQLEVASPRAVQVLESLGAMDLANLFVVSKASCGPAFDQEEGVHRHEFDVATGDSEPAARVVATARHASGTKCPRCWHFFEGLSAVCSRCVEVLDKSGEWPPKT